MGMVPYEDAFGFNSCQHFVPYVQKWALLPKSHMGEVCVDGVKQVASIWKILMKPHNIDMEDISICFKCNHG